MHYFYFFFNQVSFIYVKMLHVEICNKSEF